MKFEIKKKIMVCMLIITTLVSTMTGTISVKANDMNSATELGIGEQITATTVDGEDWYKISIPKNIRDQDIYITVVKNINTITPISMELYYSNGIQQNTRYGAPCINSWSSDISMSFCERIQSNDGGAGTLAKGQTYYLRIYGPENNSYDIKVTGDYKKASKLSVTTRKGNKYILVDTIGKATVTVKINDAIIKKNGKKVTKIVKSSGNGEIKIKLSRKLTKGDKITVTVKKNGYETKKSTKKIA